MPIVKSEEFFKKYKVPTEVKDADPAEVAEFLKNTVYGGKDPVVLTDDDKAAYDNLNKEAIDKVDLFKEQGNQIIKYMVETQGVKNFDQLSTKFQRHVGFADTVSTIQEIKGTMEGIAYDCGTWVSKDAKSQLSDRNFACGPGTRRNLQEIRANIRSLLFDLNGIIGIQKEEWIGQIFLSEHKFSTDDDRYPGSEVHRKLSLQNLVAEFYNLPVTDESKDPYLWSERTAMERTRTSSIDEAKALVWSYVESELGKENSLSGFIGMLINSGYASLPEFTEKHKEMEKQRVGGVLPKERTESFEESFDEFINRLAIKELGINMFADMNGFSYTGYRKNANSILEDAIMLKIYGDGVVEMTQLELAQLESRLLLSKLELDYVKGDYALSIDNIEESKRKLEGAGLSEDKALEYIWEQVVKRDVKLLEDEFDDITDPIQYMIANKIRFSDSLVTHISNKGSLDEVIALQKAVRPDLSIAKIIIDSYNTGALVEYVEKYDLSPDEKDKVLECAIDNVNPKLFATLLEKYPSLAQPGNWLLKYLCSKTNPSPDMITSAIKAGADFKDIEIEGITLLNWASKDGHTEVVQALIEKGADVNIQDRSGSTALHRAASYGHLDIANALMDAKADLEVKTRLGNTALHIAVSNYRLDVVNALLAKGADINARDVMGGTALNICNDIDILNALLAKGADINIQGANGKTALHHAAETGLAAKVNALFEAGADVDIKDENGNTALHYASSLGNEDVVNALLAKGADVTIVDAQGKTALHYAALRGHDKIMCTLIKAGADFKDIEIEGTTLLNWAAEKGHKELVEALIAKGADVTIVDAQGKTALHYAAEKGKGDIVEALIAKGADVTIVDAQGKTALHIAAEQMKLEYYYSDNNSYMTMYHLIEAGAEFKDVEIKGDSLLHWASKNNFIPFIEKLLQKGADINSTNANGQTPLHFAAYNNNGGAVQTLISKGAKFDEVNKFGMTPLMYAATHDNIDMVNELIKAGANVKHVDKEDHTALYWAATEINTEVFKALLEAGAEFDKDMKINGEPLLHFAALGGDVPFANMLLGLGADIDIKDQYGDTLLKKVAEMGVIDGVEELIKAGAEFKDLKIFHSPILHWAIENDHLEVVKALLSSDKMTAEILNAKDDGKTALQYATEKGNTEVVDLIKAKVAELEALKAKEAAKPKKFAKDELRSSKPEKAKPLEEQIEELKNKSDPEKPWAEKSTSRDSDNSRDRT